MTAFLNDAPVVTSHVKVWLSDVADGRAPFMGASNYQEHAVDLRVQPLSVAQLPG